MGNTVVQTGLLAAFAGVYFLLDPIDVSFRSESHILNTYGWQISMMYSVYLLGIMARDLLEGRREQIAVCVMSLSALVDVGMILMSFTGVVLIYDTLRLWVILQWVSCPVIIICCFAELFSGRKKNTIDLAVFVLIFSCILLDSTGVMNSIYSRNSMTKAAGIFLFVLKFVQFSRSMIVNFRASSQAHKLEKELKESRIALMLSQIQPHFIFNILGTIRGLCRENPEQAWRGLGDFSSYLRANMNALTNEKFIPFEREAGNAFMTTNTHKKSQCPQGDTGILSSIGTKAHFSIILLPRSSATTPVRQVSMIPRGRMTSLKALILEGSPVTSMHM